MSRACSLSSGPWREPAVSPSGCLRAARSPAGTPVVGQGDELRAHRLVLQAEAGHAPRCREDRCGWPRPLMSVYRPPGPPAAARHQAAQRSHHGRSAGSPGRVAPHGRHGVRRARVCLSTDRRPDVPALSAMRPGHGPSHQGQCWQARPWAGPGHPRCGGHGLPGMLLSAAACCQTGAGASPTPPGHVRRGGNMRLPMAAGSL